MDEHHTEHLSLALSAVSFLSLIGCHECIVCIGSELMFSESPLPAWMEHKVFPIYAMGLSLVLAKSNDKKD